MKRKGISLIIIIIVIAVILVLSVALILNINNMKNADEKDYNSDTLGTEEKINNNVSKKDNKKTSETAKKVAENPSLYYGTTVTNYSANGVSDWKIFHSDGENIYLITSDYIDVDKIPLTKSGNKLENTNSNFPKAAPLKNAVSDSAYSTGSAAIESSNPARKWLASYLVNYSSTYNNMKAIAYMMDTSVCNTFKDDRAEYAIGGPTIDMLLASYSKKHNVDYQAKATSATGYQISKDGVTNWSRSYAGMSISDSLCKLK